MSLRWYYRPSWRPLATDPAVEFTDSVRLVSADGLTEQAEEGSVGTSRIEVDDPLGALDIPPLTRIWAVETAVAAASNSYAYHGYIADRSILRADSMRTGTARVWQVDMVDENSVLSRRILSSSSADRPQESDVARVTWLANHADGQLLIDDTQYLFAAGAVTMDPADYRGQTAMDVLNDCAEQSGKNFYAYFNPNLGTGIWYGSAEHTARSSALRLSNVLSDVDNVTTFAITEDSHLDRSPSRLASSIYATYAEGSTYVRDSSMFSRIGLRDVPMSWPNVKTVATATARANRLLTQLSTEEDRVTCGVYLPAALVTAIKAGTRVQFKASHMSGYESFVWLRVLSCSVTFNSEQTDQSSYLLTLVLSSDAIPAIPAPATFAASGILYQPANGGGGGIHPAVRFGSSGDAPAPGYPGVPLQGSLAYVTDTLYGGGVYTFKGFQALGAGTLNVRFRGSDAAGVTGSVSCVPAILKNGAIVGSSSHSDSGGLRFHSFSWDFAVDVAVVNGDVISSQMTSSWGSAMTVPSGAGGNAESLYVTGDLT